MNGITSGAIPDVWAETCDLVSQIPQGMVSTYGAIAEALGDRRGARFVALVIKTRAGATHHRVVRSDGSLGGASAPICDVAEKSRLLKAEGVSVTGGRVVDLGECLFAGFKSSRPLEILRRDQLLMRARLEIPSDDIRAETIAGVDVAYDGDRAWASLAIYNIASGRLLRTECVESQAIFPYIPTYLAYRELPVVGALVSRIEPGSILMYDGNGILHPEGFGVASHAGVMFGLPTIGVAKRLLCGVVKEGGDPAVEEVRVDGRLAGYAVSRGQKSPIYVSPGHGVGHSQSLELVQTFLRHRIPEPIREAHFAAVEARRSASNK